MKPLFKVLIALRFATVVAGSPYFQNRASTSEDAPSAGVSVHAEELEVVTVKVPTQLVIETYKTRVDVSTREFQPIRIEARPNLTRGTLVEMNLRVGDKLRSDGMSLKSGINEVPAFATVLTLGLNGVPNTGEAFTYEYTITFFETEEPPGRMWSAKRGKGYKVLWTKTLKGEVK